MMAFTGFPPAAFEFYEGLEADNTKVFWQANKSTFETCVKAPMAALCADLADDGSFHLFRPYNDLRFAKNRPPYKTHQGAYRETEGGAGQYLHIGSDGMLVGVGYYSMAKDQLERFRAAVDDDRSGAGDRRRHRVVARRRLLDRGDGGAEVGAAWLRQGPPAHRAAAPQGADGVAVVAGRQRGCTRRRPRRASARPGTARRHCAPGSTPTSGRARCRPTTGADRLSQ